MSVLKAAYGGEKWHFVQEQWYLPSEKRDLGSSTAQFVDGFFNFLAMLIIMQVLIPVSLYVTMEFVKLGQAEFSQKEFNFYYSELRHRLLWGNI